MIGIDSPDVCHSPKFIVDGDLNADFTSSTVKAEFYRTATFQIQVTSTTTPAGTFAIQGSNDETNWDSLYIDANKVHGTIDGSAAAHAGGFTVAITGSADSDFIIALSDGLPRFLRLFYDSTSGGAADTLDGTVTLRS